MDISTTAFLILNSEFLISPDDIWIILTAFALAIPTSLLGCLLILRKQALISDAIAHSVLPGIILAYLLSKTMNKWSMLLGAAAFGLISTFLIEWLEKKAKLQADAAMGTIFTFLFAVGVILASAYTGQVHIDLECVLYGEIAFTPLNRWITNAGSDMGPIAFWTLTALSVGVIAIVAIGFKAFRLSSFDELYAQTIGMKTGRWHYLLMTMVSITTVLAFESVGAILVLAFFIIPPATAFLIANDLKNMMLYALLFSTISIVIGYGLAIYVNGSITGAIATIMGVVFGLVAISKNLYKTLAANQTI